MIPELPDPYKTRMDNAVLGLQEQAHIAFDIVREFGSAKVEVFDGELRVVVEEGEAQT